MKTLNRKEIIEIAQNNPKGLIVWKTLCEMNHCTHCSAKIKPITPQPGQTLPLYKMINVDYLIHMKTTHGLEPEDVVDTISKLL